MSTIQHPMRSQSSYTLIIFFHKMTLHVTSIDVAPIFVYPDLLLYRFVVVKNILFFSVFRVIVSPTPPCIAAVCTTKPFVGHRINNTRICLHRADVFCETTTFGSMVHFHPEMLE
jgi:hypothetical protein